MNYVAIFTLIFSASRNHCPLDANFIFAKKKVIWNQIMRIVKLRKHRYFFISRKFTNWQRLQVLSHYRDKETKSLFAICLYVLCESFFMSVLISFKEYLTVYLSLEYKFLLNNNFNVRKNNHHSIDISPNLSSCFVCKKYIIFHFEEFSFVSEYTNKPVFR